MVAPSVPTVVEPDVTDKDYVVRVADMKRLDLMKPTRACPGVLVYDMRNKDARGVYPCVIDAKTWTEAKEQLIAYYRA